MANETTSHSSSNTGPWVMVLGIVGSAGLGGALGYWLGGRERPCACKAKHGNGNGNGNGKANGNGGGPAPSSGGAP